MPKFHVERSIQIDADPDRVFEVVSDFGTWTTWSPWLCAEPEAAVTVTDDPSSIGSVYAWDGEVVGKGEIEHRELDRGKSIVEEIRFIRPFSSTSKVSFCIDRVGSETRLAWTMDGALPWFMFWMKSSMQGFIGMDYDRGLKMLKDLIETGKIESETNVIGIESIDAMRVAGVRKTCSRDDIGDSMKSAFEQAARRMESAGLSTDCDAVSVYHKVDMKQQVFDFTSGYRVDAVASVPDNLSVWTLPATRAFRVDHTGSYKHLGNAWSAAYQHVRYKKLKQRKGLDFEIYRNDPNEIPAAELQTSVFLPLKK